MLAVYLSWSDEPGMGAEGRFSACLISQDPFLCFAKWEGSLYQIGRIHILFFFSRPKYSLERSVLLAKDIPKHEAVVLTSSCQWLFSFLPSPVPPALKQKAPLYKGGDCFPAAAVTGASILICSPSLNPPLRFRNKRCNLCHQQHQRDLAFRSKIERLLAGVKAIT